MYLSILGVWHSCGFLIWNDVLSDTCTCMYLVHTHVLHTSHQVTWLVSVHSIFPTSVKLLSTFCVAFPSVSHVFHVERSEHQGSASLVFGTFRLLGGAYALLHGLLLPLHPLGGISVSHLRGKFLGSHDGLPWDDWYNLPTWIPC